MTSLADAITAERAARRAVIRWHALYGKCRKRMAAMDASAAEALHWRLKDETDAAIDAHYGALRRVREAAAAEGVTLLADIMRERRRFDDDIDDIAANAGVTLGREDRAFLRRILRPDDDGNLAETPELIAMLRHCRHVPARSMSPLMAWMRELLEHSRALSNSSSTASSCSVPDGAA
jgi:hypothetical protein